MAMQKGYSYALGATATPQDKGGPIPPRVVEVVVIDGVQYKKGSISHRQALGLL